MAKEKSGTDEALLLLIERAMEVNNDLLLGRSETPTGRNNRVLLGMMVNDEAIKRYVESFSDPTYAPPWPAWASDKATSILPSVPMPYDKIYALKNTNGRSNKRYIVMRHPIGGGLYRLSTLYGKIGGGLMWRELNPKVYPSSKGGVNTYVANSLFDEIVDQKMRGGYYTDTSPSIPPNFYPFEGDGYTGQVGDTQSAPTVASAPEPEPQLVGSGLRRKREL